LKYFGENIEGYSCNKCDRCLNDTKYSDNVREYISEVVLKTLAESKKNLTENLLINILRGTAKSFENLGISSFGVCRNYNREELKSFIHSSIEKGLIEQIRDKTKVLKISSKGLQQIGQEIIPGLINDTEDYQENLVLFNLLREARSKAAKKFSQNGLIICPDEILREIAKQKPLTKEEFLSIQHTNPRMFNKIGEDFLEIIRNFRYEPKSNLTASQERIIPTNIQETYSLLKKGYNLKDISQLRKTSESIISMQIESIIEYEPEINIEHLFNSNELKKIKTEIEKGYNDLKDLKLRLDNSVTYPMLRIAVAKFKFI